MDDIKDHPLIKQLGSKFKLTEVHFSVNYATGLPFDVESDVSFSTVLHFDVSSNTRLPFDGESNKNVKDEAVCDSQIESITPDSGSYTHTHAVDGSPGCLEVSGSRYPDKCDTVIDESNWITCWAQNSKKYHNYNQITQESTSEPPLGIEKISSFLQLVGSELTANSVDRSEERSLSVGNKGLKDVLWEDLEGGVLWERYFSRIGKYWSQRYMLFSKYDEGIQMDEEGWFSATHECIAEHQANRCGGGVLVDCFTGVGGNAIRFAPKTTHVIAIGIDPKKIECARHNATVYGVEDHIDFIIGDSFILARKLKADTVFLSPPWGGPRYNKAKPFDLDTMLMAHSGQSLFDMAKTIASRVVMYLPKNVDVGQLAQISLSASPAWKLEVEKNILNDELKAITAYFTNPVYPYGDSQPI